MSGGNQSNSVQQHTPLQKRLYLAGVVALIGGLIAAVIIYVAAPAPDSAVSMYSIADPRYQIELPRIGGNAAVLGAAIAGLCFFVGYYFAGHDDTSAP
ncbi:MAG: FIG00464765: hypothetical protein [uncultured Paraburkholderia sp.]|nr:MAG: FIG00464765: hypothetical protein [uncultured Paraburkholderia sp.]CAH2919731.1 MAG: FIG00464765: hypothetical protein [uncultured Paraburkholderia sp.]